MAKSGRQLGKGNGPAVCKEDSAFCSRDASEEIGRFGSIGADGKFVAPFPIPLDFDFKLVTFWTSLGEKDRTPLRVLS